jgi:predicted anti-sigma-YlaC factor YlaD
MSETSSGRPLTCARVRVLMESYVDGDLAVSDSSMAKSVRLHLSTCDDCRRQHDHSVSLPFRLKALRSPIPPATLMQGVMDAIQPARTASRRAWALLVPEGLLVAFIVWYLSGLDGLASAASGTVTDLQVLLNWGVGAADLPSVPVADVFLLIALIALAITAAYHLAVLSRLGDRAGGPQQSLHGHRRA